MFKFGNFDGRQDEINEENVDEISAPAKEIAVNASCNHQDYTICKYAGDNILINYLDPMEILQNASETDPTIRIAEQNHSDLVDGIYEGGLKIWECTYDVVNYLCNENRTLPQDKIVLDLGCGSGILGILAHKFGANQVHFQDYNEGVIRNLTIPNVALNGDDFIEKSKFWSGDWKSFTDINKIKYDLLLTSETIYNPRNYRKLLIAFKTFLKPNGIIILAGKSYYFGVGGGIKPFQDFIDKDGTLRSQCIWSSETGIKREILQICFK